MSHPHIPDQEFAIVMALLIKALNMGYTVSVYDGEEWVLRKSTSLHTITEAMGSTETDTLRFRDRDGVVVGQVLLIYGNGRDVISDWTDNAAMNTLTANIPGTDA